MGVVNVTPDSFSDGGRWFDHAAPSPTAWSWWPRGRTWSTSAASRPGRAPSRSTPPRSSAGCCPSSRPWPPTGGSPSTPATPRPRPPPWPRGPRSSTTSRPRSAPVAAERGRRLGGDAHAGRPADDAGRPAVRRRRRRGARLPGRRGPSEAVAAGVDEVWIDPGFGFGKTLDHNLDAAGRPRRAGGDRLPGAVGLSRKGFLGRLLAAADAAARPRRRSPASTAAPALADDRPPCRPTTASRGRSAAACGPSSRACSMVRVHDVARHGARRRAGRRGTDGEPLMAKRGQVGAQGIQPRNFAWFIKDRLAVCERPGGYGDEPPPGAPPGGDHLDPRAGLRLRDLDHPVAPQPPQLRRARRGLPAPAVRRRRRPARRCSGPSTPRSTELIGRRDEGDLHGEEVGDRLVGLVGGYIRWAAWCPRGRRRSRSSRRSAAASSTRSAAASSPSPPSSRRREDTEPVPVPSRSPPLGTAVRAAPATRRSPPREGDAKRRRARGPRR